MECFPADISCLFSVITCVEERLICLQYTVKSVYFMGMKFSGLTTMDMFNYVKLF